jgi:hypothetical protein
MNPSRRFCPGCQHILDVDVAHAGADTGCPKCGTATLGPHADPCPRCGGTVSPDGELCVDCDHVFGHDAGVTDRGFKKTAIRLATAAALGAAAVLIFHSQVLEALETGVFDRRARRVDLVRADDPIAYWCFVLMHGAISLLMGVCALGAAYSAITGRGPIRDLAIGPGRRFARLSRLIGKR